MLQKALKDFFCDFFARGQLKTFSKKYSKNKKHYYNSLRVCDL